MVQIKKSQEGKKLSPISKSYKKYLQEENYLNQIINQKNQNQIKNTSIKNLQRR